jgi:hypothetical protein
VVLSVARCVTLGGQTRTEKNHTSISVSFGLLGKELPMYIGMLNGDTGSLIIHPKQRVCFVVNSFNIYHKMLSVTCVPSDVTCALPIPTHICTIPPIWLDSQIY